MKNHQLNLIKIKSKWISDKLFAGNFLSKFTGEWLSFKELREYDSNDDYKSIDWLTSAKMNKPFVKVNETERNNNIILAFDISKSIEAQVGTQGKSKKDILSEISNIIAYSFIKNNDRIGAVFFSDKIEKAVPLSKNKNILAIITNVLHKYKPVSSGTNIGQCLKYLVNSFPKNSIVIIFSDFYTNENFEKYLAIASQKFKLLAIKFADSADEMLITSGIIKVYNNETGQMQFVKLTPKLKADIMQKQTEMKAVLKKHIRHFVEITNFDDYLKALLSLFNNA